MKLPPRPWYVDRDERPDMEWNNHILSADGNTVCFMAHNPDDNTALENAAHVITAAGDLFEALKGAIGALEFSRDYHKDLGNEDQAFAQDRLDAALKAIARATGAPQ